MITSIDQIVESLRNKTLTEIAHENIELKSSWDAHHGKKISAYSNRNTQNIQYMCVGVDDGGNLLQRDEGWAKKNEEVISQHINGYLDPQFACKTVTCHNIEESWFIVIAYKNPGTVVYWQNEAYKAAGTTIEVMKPEEIIQMTVSLPGLTDYSAQQYNGAFNEELVKSYAITVAQKHKGTMFETIATLEPGQALERIGIGNRVTQNVLFGDITYRLVKYDNGNNPIYNKNIKGLASILETDFITMIQDWSYQNTNLTNSFPERSLKEGLANAVAHAAYFEKGGDVVIELFTDKVCISNLCIREAQYFANRWFSRSRRTVNPMLMETLRLAGYVDELGRGKNLIFSESLINGKKPPVVDLEKGGRYDRWRLYLYGGSVNREQLRVLDRLKQIYNDDQKAMIANALVLWQGHSVSSIKQYVDGESARLFAEVLADIHGPIFYYEEKDKIILRRWVRVLIGEGKDSKKLSQAEEEELYDFASKMQLEYHRGYITPKELRDFAGMGHTASEISLCTELLNRWKHAGKIERIRKGVYKFPNPEISYADLIKGLQDKFTIEIKNFDSSLYLKN